jgi:hypothetical protein
MSSETDLHIISFGAFSGDLGMSHGSLSKVIYTLEKRNNFSIWDILV